MRSLRHPTAADSARRHFRIVLIKPSHYDDDGSAGEPVVPVGDGPGVTGGA